MRGFHEPGELGCRNQGDVARASSSYDYSVLLIYHLVEHRGQVLAEAGIRRFARHGSLDPYCTGFLYDFKDYKAGACETDGRRWYDDFRLLIRRTCSIAVWPSSA